MLFPYVILISSKQHELKKPHIIHSNTFCCMLFYMLKKFLKNLECENNNFFIYFHVHTWKIDIQMICITIERK